MGSWPEWISVWCLYAKCILQKCLYEHLSLYLSTRIKIQKRRWLLHSPIPLVKLVESSPNRVTRPWHEQIQQESQIKAVFLEWNEWPQPIPGPFHLLSPPLPAFTSINKGPGWLKPGPSTPSQLRGQAIFPEKMATPRDCQWSNQEHHVDDDDPWSTWIDQIVPNKICTTNRPVRKMVGTWFVKLQGKSTEWHVQ